MSRSNENGTVQSLLRALDLLKIIADEPDGLRLVQIAERSGYAVSTVHRLLTTLEERQFVSFDKITKNWGIGSQCLAVGAGYARRRNLGAVAHPVMHRLLELRNLTVNLAMADAGKSQMTLISQATTPVPVAGLARPGRRSPITSTALGCAVIASLSDGELNQILHTSTDQPPARKSVAVCIAEARQRLFAVDNGVNSTGLRCIAAPIFDEHGNPIAALSVVGDAPQIEPGSLTALGHDVRRAAAEVTHNIGGWVPLRNAS